MTTPEHHKFHQDIASRNKIDYIPVNVPEENEYSLNCSDKHNHDKNATQSCVDALPILETSNLELGGFIDNDAVDELVKEMHELRKGLLVLLLLFVTIAAAIALDDHYSTVRLANNNVEYQQKLSEVDKISQAPDPHMGYKIQINASAFTVNDFECLQLDTGNWPSERVHCELRPSTIGENAENASDDEARYDFVVEHFDDENCREPNAKNPVVRHTASGCYFFEAFNHSYNDLCHMNRTLTVSAFYGPGCMTPMPVTAVNVKPEDE